MSCAAQTAGNTGSEDQLGCGVATQRVARLLVSVRVAYTAEITMWFSVVGRLEPVVSAGALAWAACCAGLREPKNAFPPEASCSHLSIINLLRR